MSGAAENIAWPAWMLRYLATDDESAFWDLVWSVGGSPPYGGVDWDEARAVYELVESYRGPGMASPQAYAAVQEAIGDDPTKQAAVAAFAAMDSITSNPDGFTAEPVEAGLTIADAFDHQGLLAAFTLLQAQLYLGAGDMVGGLEAVMMALRWLLPLAEEDDAYAHRVSQAAHNAVALTGNVDGRDAAVDLLGRLDEVLTDESRIALRRSLGLDR